jgi:hypothetical protein
MNAIEVMQTLQTLADLVIKHGAHSFSFYDECILTDWSAMLAEVERLQDIVDKLPKYANGATVRIGDEAWAFNARTQKPQRWGIVAAVSSKAIMAYGGNLFQSAERFFPTRSAAEAAAKEAK